jgi:hypothetical protein
MKPSLTLGLVGTGALFVIGFPGSAPCKAFPDVPGGGGRPGACCLVADVSDPPPVRFAEDSDESVGGVAAFVCNEGALELRLNPGPEMAIAMSPYLI